ncbi:hypothetical protein ACFO1B_43805 [Dactylosporangium siamense]|uniref:Uncharacterized protein n=1 Tax=Dactylosporangium siamense TaxID=685454 RepID=A0A919Q241_9ACTN|nr:hypothetical protein [Dactylosporangium siamense]GIG52863.1 hypothetical protein Dsi01nite_109040 [Dactylosporangium siamense]
MLIGDNDLLYQRRRVAPQDLVTVVKLPRRLPGPPANTIMLSTADLADLPVTVRTRDGNRTAHTATDGPSLLPGLQLGAAIAETIADLGGQHRSAFQTPVFCATRHQGGWHVYSRAHQRPGRWCFIRTSTEPITATVDDLCWLDPAVALHADHASVLNSHAYTKPPMFAGKEVETKFTLPHQTPIWPLAVQSHELMTAGAIPNMVPRFGMDFESRDFDNYLFDVKGPETQRGYVSFMAVRPNLYRLKRKRFNTDALVREEDVSSEFNPGQPLDAYVRDVLRLDARQLPTFRRIRHDIMFESVATGGHYSIIFDRSTLHADPDETLVQCEIEYMRTRSVLAPDIDLIMNEFAALTSWCADFLRENGIAANANYYSKLTFLRDVIQRRPKLRW